MPKKLIEFLGKTFYQLDLFMTNSTLRHKNKPYTGSVCLGVLSLTILGLFTYLLASKLIATFGQSSDQLKSTQTLSYVSKATNFENVHVGFSFLNSTQFEDPNEIKSYFSLVMYYWDNKQNKYIKEVMDLCKPDQWKLLGQNYTQIFYQNSLNYAWCPQKNLNINISKVNKELFNVTFYWCNSLHYNNCKSQQQINSLYQKIYKSQYSFPIYVFTLAQAPNVQQQDPISYYLNIQQFIPSKNFSQNIDQDYQSFEIDTDKSYFSLQQFPEKKTGNVLGPTKYGLINGYKAQGFTIFCYNGIFSPKLYSITRKYSSIDQIISYIGGLFGILVAILFIFLKRYDQIKYELDVGESSFNYNSDGKKVRAKDLNFWSYLKYGFFNFIQYIFGRQPPMKRTNQMNQTVQEAVNVLDVQKIYQKFEFIQKSVWKTSNQNFIKCKAVQQLNAIQTVRAKRNILSYYEQIVNLKQAASVEDALNNRASSFQYLKQIEDKLTNSTSHQNIYSVKQSFQQIYKSFVQDLGLSQQISLAISQYGIIAQQAKRLQITKQFLEIQKFISCNFVQLSTAQKNDLVKKMPILILHRLRLRIKQMKMNFTFQSYNPDDYNYNRNNKAFAFVKQKNQTVFSKIRQQIVNFLWALDMFSAEATFRIEKKAQKATTCFGILSFLILGVFVYLFISGIIQIVNIDSKQIKTSRAEKLLKQKTPVSNIMYAVKFIDLSDYLAQIGANESNVFNYFDISFASKNTINSTYQLLDSEPCTAEKFSLIGEGYQKQFNKYGLDKAICLKNPVNVTQTSNQNQFFKLFVLKCNQTQNSNCESSINIDNYLMNAYEKNKNFEIQIYYIASSAEIDDPNPFHYRLESMRVGRTQKSVTRVVHQYHTVMVDTERSLVSFSSSVESQKRVIPYKISISNLDDSQTDYLFQLYGETRSKLIRYNRKIKSLDDLFSYLGGLFGFVVVFFAWWIGSYNQYRYELGIAQNCYSFDNYGKKIGQKYLNAWTYIKFSIFDWIATIFCYQPKWRRTTQMNQTRQQALNMLDPQNLFRRLQFLEDLIWEKAQKKFIMSICLMEQDTIEQSSRNRLLKDYYKQVVQLKNIATVQDAINNNPEAFEYLKDIKQEKNGQNLKQIELSNTGKQLNNQYMINLNAVGSNQKNFEDLGINSTISEKISNYPLIEQQAKNIHLNNQLLDVQLQLTKAFMKLDWPQKQKLLPNIPIVILHRLKLRASEIKNIQITQGMGSSNSSIFGDKSSSYQIMGKNKDLKRQDEIMEKEQNILKNSSSFGDKSRRSSFNQNANATVQMFNFLDRSKFKKKDASELSSLKSSF